MEQDKKVAVIGHGNHSTTMLRLLSAQMRADKDIKDVIVVDECNVAEIVQQMRGIQLDTTSQDIAEIKLHAYTNIIPEMLEPIHMISSENYRKQHKPNKGISLGSYKYKSK